MDLTNLRHFIREISRFRQGDTRAFLLMFFLSMLTMGYISARVHLSPKPPEMVFKELPEVWLDSAQVPGLATTAVSGGPVYFDPNTAAAKDMIRVGLPAKVANTIVNYRNKGGKFFKKEDLKKIYGLRDSDYKKVAPYIRLYEKEHKNNYDDKPREQKSYEYQRKKIDINRATAEEFETLYGIGVYLAKRIVNFREKLGGFYAVEQVGETYGIADSVFQVFKNQLEVNQKDLVQININRADFQQLDAHPYISKKLALEIIALREKLGTIENLESLHSLKNWDNHSLEQVRPYLKISD